MKWLLLIVAFFSLEVGFAQEEEIYSIFFEFDKYNLKEEQAEGVIAFVQKIDTTRKMDIPLEIQKRNMRNDSFKIAW